jgi:hypothetical protein
MKKKLPLLFLSFIPTGLFVYGILMVRCICKYYINWSDPTYAYLFNGLNLASGKLVLGHVDHPGTPVQCFTACMIRIIHFLRGTPSLVNDVLARPEAYLSPICYTISFLGGLSTFIAGLYIYKKSGQLWQALFFQFISLVSFEIVYFSSNLMTEPFLVAGALFLSVFVYKYSLEDNFTFGIKYPLWFGLISGFLMAVKISSTPLVFVPLFLLSGKKNKILFLFFTLIFFLAFIAPALNDISRFTDFMNGVWHHTGIYGSGKEGFIDPSAFKHNLYLIFTNEWIFPPAYFFIFISCLILIFRNGLRNSIRSVRFRMITGSWVSMTIQILIVAKHYSSHYLFPAYCLIIPGLFFSISTLNLFPSLFNPAQQKKWMEVALLLLASVIFSRDFIRTDFTAFAKTSDGATFRMLEKYPNVAKIILTGYSSTPCPEPALNFGLAYSGSLKQTYTNSIKNLYPDSYFFSHAGDYFYSWQNGQEFILKDILYRNTKLIIYVCKKDKKSEKMVLDKLKAIKANTGALSIKKIFTNTENGDVIYEITTDPEKLNYHLTLQNTILCSMETLTPERTALKSNSSYTFRGAEFLSEEQAFSGKKSIKLSSENEFSLQGMVPAKPGCLYEISIWKQSNKNDLALVATSKDGNFYKSGQVACEKKGEWSQIKISFELPLNYKSDSIQIYVWNSKNGTVYLDDLSIKEWSY